MEDKKNNEVRIYRLPENLDSAGSGKSEDPRSLLKDMIETNNNNIKKLNDLEQDVTTLSSLVQFISKLLLEHCEIEESKLKEEWMGYNENIDPEDVLNFYYNREDNNEEKENNKS